MRLRFRLSTALVALTVTSLIGAPLQGPYAALIIVAAVEALLLLGCVAWILLWIASDPR